MALGTTVGKEAPWSSDQNQTERRVVTGESWPTTVAATRFLGTRKALLVFKCDGGSATVTEETGRNSNHDHVGGIIKVARFEEDCAVQMEWTRAASQFSRLKAPLRLVLLV